MCECVAQSTEQTVSRVKSITKALNETGTAKLPINTLTIATQYFELNGCQAKSFDVVKLKNNQPIEVNEIVENEAEPL